MVTASARSLPALMYSIEEDMLANMTCTRFDDKRLTKPLLQPLAHQTLLRFESYQAAWSSL